MDDENKESQPQQTTPASPSSDSKSMYWVVAAIIAIAVIALGYVLIKNKNAQTQAPTVQTQAQASPQDQMVMAVALAEQNRSGQNGIVTWEEKDGKAVVTVDITNEPAGANEPAHLHNGTCAKPGDVKIPLNPVVDGKSVTTLALSLADLKSQLPLVANVHKSQTQVNVYVACGTLTADTPQVTIDDAMKMLTVGAMQASPAASPKASSAASSAPTTTNPGY